jgi:hypothetical protein
MIIRLPASWGSKGTGACAALSNLSRGWRVRFFATAILAVLFLSSCHRAANPTAEARRHSTREGQKIILYPSGVSFRIPQKWLEWHERFHDNLHLTRDELEKVRDGDGEWDTEYGKVVNATLPFADCAAHVGGEGWGRGGSSFGDVQLRAYISDLGEREILSRIHGQAFDAARRVARPFPTSPALAELAPGTDVTDRKERQWRKLIIRYPLWYGDYGGVARVRFYVATIEKETLVLVFMGGEDEEVDGILQSVSSQYLMTGRTTELASGKRRSRDSIREGSAMIAVGPGKPADFILYEEFLSWKWPLFL